LKEAIMTLAAPMPEPSLFRTMQSKDGLDPTRTTYVELTEVYDFFNERLFAGRLPRCLITYQRRRSSYGYFARGRFGTKDGAEVTDEIALNPLHFKARTTEQVLSTLAHEMVHLEQYHFGKPSRGGYHNREWASLMQRIGLMPSDTGQPGGRKTGQRMTHYVVAGEPFEAAVHELISQGFDIRYVDLGHEAQRGSPKMKAKYNCPACGLNVWGRPNANVGCLDCGQTMIAEDA
jgi:predicted SprT family Zn-dependent metalloprotease